MKYLTSFYWQQEEPAATSLLLQHFVYRKGKRQGMFACICTTNIHKDEKERDEFSFFTESLKHWFQSTGRAMFHRDVRNGTSETGKHLKMWIDCMNREFAYYCQSRGQAEETVVDLIGLICEENHFLLFCQGRHKAYLLNSCFGRAHCKCITKNREKSDLQLIEGSMEEQIAILLASREFGGNLSEGQMAECLSVQEIIRTGKAEGRLRELGEEAVRKGGQHIGAILLTTASQVPDKRYGKKTEG